MLKVYVFENGDWIEIKGDPQNTVGQLIEEEKSNQ